jgi:hypothetical protein
VVALKSSREKFFESNVTLFLPFFVNYAVIISSLLIISALPKDTNVPLQLDNSPGNFPMGSVTAVFSPDTQVFLDFGMWKSWYFLTVEYFTIFLILFLILNWNLNKIERGIRCGFYSIVFLVLPIVANMLNLILIGQSTLGPSGAFYTSEGLVTGFGLVNLWAGDAAGGLRNMTSVREMVFFVLNAAIALGLLLFSFADQAGFFSEAIGNYKVGYGIHISCFYSAVAISLLFSYLRRSSLRLQGTTSIPTDFST